MPGQINKPVPELRHVAIQREPVAKPGSVIVGMSKLFSSPEVNSFVLYTVK
ncbi:hypothetical protein ACFS7Z_13385 [Pontibacter toksunensis]|uniref:Uncharacterized protein n=1 Tax=Pontibacter toksunensis TaxID=1332631 RepID=A0ABW6BVS4_9BACT